MGSTGRPAELDQDRLATPADVAKVVEFFVTDLGDYVTGQCLSVYNGALKF